MKYSSDSYKKMSIIDGRYNWRKLLLLTSVKLLSKLVYFQNSTDTKSSYYR